MDKQNLHRPISYKLLSAIIVLLTLASSGCYDSMVKFGRTVGNSATVHTVSAEQFMQMVHTKPAYPMQYEYRGLKGSYHYIYYFDKSVLKKVTTLQAIYRINDNELSDSAKDYLREEREIEEYGGIVVRKKKEEEEKEEAPHDPNKVNIPTVGGF